MSSSEDEALLQQLTTEELKELGEYIDPEDQLLPAGYRQPDQTEKELTGAFDRQHLLDYMKEEAYKYEDDEEVVPYEKNVKRGKVFINKNKPEMPSNKILDFSDELLAALDNATDAEIADLASLIGVHGIVYHRDDDSESEDELSKERRKKGIVKYAKSRVEVPDEPDNDTDIDESIEMLRNNDPNLRVLNLNNHKEINDNKLLEVIKALANNTSVKVIALVNTKMRDHAALELSKALIKNSSIEELNIESNHISTIGLSAVVATLATNTTLKCLKLSNQSQSYGAKLEEESAKVLENNKTLLKFGLTFGSPGPRQLVHQYLLRNNDFARIRRVEEEQG
ncbi:Tropomodulin-2 [Trichoplax sp. H2]|nr:Tropomodulin-2 [Trichoplax sp. H2]|eukprot:RDD47059.1 Tropomodulin-2 [Trichoplax sp. H2]